MLIFIGIDGCYKKEKKYNQPNIFFEPDPNQPDPHQSWGQCQKFCERNNKCASFTFDSASKKCFIHAEQSSTLIDQPGAISGPKFCGKIKPSYGL